MTEDLAVNGGGLDGKGQAGCPRKATGHATHADRGRFAGPRWEPAVTEPCSGSGGRHLIPQGKHRAERWKAAVDAPCAPWSEGPSGPDAQTAAAGPGSGCARASRPRVSHSCVQAQPCRSALRVSVPSLPRRKPRLRRTLQALPSPPRGHTQPRRSAPSPSSPAGTGRLAP